MIKITNYYRNQQVQLMGQIHSCARSTIIHLGRESEAVKDTFSGGLNSGTSNIDLVLRDIVQRPWFTRTWVFQELVLSADQWIQVGRQRIRWREMCRVLLPATPYSSVPKHDDVAFVSGRQILRQMEMVRGSESKRDLFSILSLRAGCRASDPRDVIFAHMGMITDEQEVLKFLRFDYKASVSDVYTSVGRYALASFGLSKTAKSIKRPRGMSHVPSWVPNWGLHSWLDDLSESTRQGLLPDDEDCHASVIVIPTTNPSLYNIRASGSRFPWSGPLKHIHCVSRVLPQVSEMELRDSLARELALVEQGSHEGCGGGDGSFFPPEFWNPPQERRRSAEKAWYIQYLLKMHYSLRSAVGPRFGFDRPTRIAISRSGYCAIVSDSARAGDFIANCPKEQYRYLPGGEIFGSTGDGISKLLVCLFRPFEWVGGNNVEEVIARVTGHPEMETNVTHCVLLDVIGETDMQAMPLDLKMTPGLINWLVVH